MVLTSSQVMLPLRVQGPHSEQQSPNECSSALARIRIPPARIPEVWAGALRHMAVTHPQVMRRYRQREELLP